MVRIAIAGLALIVATALSIIPVAAVDDGTLCTSEKTPADQALAACGRLVNSRRFSGGNLASIYFWRAVHANRKGDYTRTIGDLTEALKLQRSAAAYNMRGSAYYDKGEYDIAIADFNDAIRMEPASAIIFHNRGNAYRQKGDTAKAIADYSEAIRLDPKSPFAYQNRGVVRRDSGDLNGAVADVDTAIRLNPNLPFSYTSRGLLWRARGDVDRAIADYDEAIRLTRAGAPVPTLTPPGSLLINAHTHRGLAREQKGDLARAREDFAAALALTASDAGSRASQATAKARLAVLGAGESSPAPAPAPAQPKAGERRLALVIGNGRYASVGGLANPPNDARAIAGALRQMGFEVAEGIDVDRIAMTKLVVDFMRAAVGARTALFFYAGHGIQIDGKNYMLPVDARLDTGDLAAELADMDMVVAGLDDQIRTNIMVLDACRDNPFAKKVADKVADAGAGRSATVRAGLAMPATPGAGVTRGAGTLIAFATAPGQVALDGAGQNSPFSSALIRHLGTPGLEVQQMLTRVRADVVAATHGRQVPWSNSSLLGDVYLVK